jgi:hypothetical protein
MRRSLPFLIVILVTSFIASAAADESVTLDPVINGIGTDSIMSGVMVKFPIRLTNTTGPDSCRYIFSLNWRVYTPDGATWKADTIITSYPDYADIDTLPYLSLNQASGIDTCFSDFYFASKNPPQWPPTGSGADSMGIACIHMGPPALYKGFDDVAFYISLNPDTGSIGRTICLDTVGLYAASGYEWMWSSFYEAGKCDGPTIIPDWGGPYCFTIGPAPTVETQSVTLDPVINGIGTDSIMPGVKVQFPIRLTNITGVDSCRYNFALNWRVSSPDGATWKADTIITSYPDYSDIDTLPYLSVNAASGIDTCFDDFYFASKDAISPWLPSGSGADSLGVACIITGPPALYEGFDDVAFYISLYPDISSAGRTICLDTIGLDPGPGTGYDWEWASFGPGCEEPDLVIPDWGGPYCFTIGPASQVEAKSVTVDPVINGIGTDSIMSGVKVQFPIRMTNTALPDCKYLFSLNWRVYSPDGAIWAADTTISSYPDFGGPDIDTLPYLSVNLASGIDTCFSGFYIASRSRHHRGSVHQPWSSGPLLGV